MRIALAGATGLVGHAIAAHLTRGGHEVVTIGRGAGAHVHFDLANPAGVSGDALAGCDALVHAAGVTDEDFADRDRAWTKARAGTAALIDLAKRAGIRRLGYISTAHVYGPLAGPIDETHATDPRSDYARAHLEAEARFEGAARSSGLAALIVRPCAVFGMPPSLERFARWSLIPFSFPREALDGAIVLKSSGLQRRNFVSAEGVATLVASWLDREDREVTIANAPGPHEMPVFEFARLCARIAEQETGRACEVRRPDAVSPQEAPLEFRTRFGGTLPGPSLEDHVRRLLRALAR